MTKADLVTVIYERVGLSKKEATEIVEALFECIKNTLAEGESLKISGFGTFHVRKKGIRKGRNPKSGAEIQITPRKVVTFKPSMQFRTVAEKADS